MVGGGVKLINCRDFNTSSSILQYFNTNLLIFASHGPRCSIQHVAMEFKECCPGGKRWNLEDRLLFASHFFAKYFREMKGGTFLFACVLRYMRPNNRVGGGGTTTRIGKNKILVTQIICRFWHLQVCDAFFWISWILNLPPGIYSRENDQDVFSILWKLNILTIYGGLMKTTSNIHILTLLGLIFWKYI